MGHLLFGPKIDPKSKSHRLQINLHYFVVTKRLGLLRSMCESHSTTAVECLEYGAELFYSGMGRRPRYYSQTCRSRAYEARRAARTGVVATRVVERVVEVDARLDVDTVVRRLDGHPRRLSAVLRGMEWTRGRKMAYVTVWSGRIRIRS